MLTKNTIIGFAITMLVAGISMMIFPEFHNKGTKLNFGMPETIYVGVFFTSIGGIILLIKLYTWYDSKKSGDNDKGIEE
jgi:hypothetical protein